MFLGQLIIGALLICLTVIIHGIALDRLLFFLHWIGDFCNRTLRPVKRIMVLVICVLGLFLAHVIQVWLWAGLYLYIDSLPDLETALYFSTSTFTTVGYGDIVLDTEWRLLSSFQSANGFILFGWSTAFIFEVTSKLYKGVYI